MTVGKHFILLKILYHLKNVSLTFSFSVKSYKKLCDFSWNLNIFLHSVSFFKFVKLVGCQSSTGGHSPIWLHVLESSRNLVFRIAQLHIFSPHKMMTWTRFPPQKKTPLNIICPSIFSGQVTKLHKKKKNTGDVLFLKGQISLFLWRANFWTVPKLWKVFLWAVF